MARGSIRRTSAAGGSRVRSMNSKPISAIQLISAGMSRPGWFIVPISIGLKLQLFALLLQTSKPCARIEISHAIAAQTNNATQRRVEAKLLPKLHWQLTSSARAKPGIDQQNGFQQRDIIVEAFQEASPI